MLFLCRNSRISRQNLESLAKFTLGILDFIEVLKVNLEFLAKFTLGILDFIEVLKANLEFLAKFALGILEFLGKNLALHSWASTAKNCYKSTKY